MSAPHTPGPWAVMPRNPDAKGLEFQAGVYRPLPNAHDLIAEVYVTTNAGLIAAAPEMLAALKAINEWCGTDDGYHALPFEPPWNRAMLTAIAKAEGKPEPEFT